MAIYEQDVVMFETKENGDKVIKMPISRANNIEGIGRSANTAYVVGDVVYVDNNKKVALKCTKAGTTSNSELNVSTASIGDVITDGSVVWQVCNRTSDVTSVNGKIGDVVVDTLPIGTIIPFSGNTVPTGYLACNGAAVRRTTYADLFAVIGTTYGSGDGSTTFNLPNLNNNSFLEGSDVVGTVKSAGLPDITGGVQLTTVRTNGVIQEPAGAFSVTELRSYPLRGGDASAAIYYANFSAKNSNSTYGNSNTVQPKAVTVKFCIKY